MKKYTRPELLVSVFDVEDIITASSGNIVDSDSLSTEGKDMYTIYLEQSSVDNANVSEFYW